MLICGLSLFACRLPGEYSWCFKQNQTRKTDPRTTHSLMRGTKQMRRVRAKIETAKARAGEITS